MTTIQFQVGKGKASDPVFHVELDDAAPGVLGDGPVDEADFTMILMPSELAAVVAGETTLDVGYMRGTVKVTGNIGRMLSVLPLLTTEEFARGLAEASTD